MKTVSKREYDELVFKLNEVMTENEDLRIKTVNQENEIERLKEKANRMLNEIIRIKLEECEPCTILQ